MRWRTYRDQTLFVQPLVVTGLMWVLLELLVVLATVPQASAPALVLVTTVGAAVAVAALLAVRLDRGDLPRPAAVAVAAVLPLATLLNAFAFAPGAQFSPYPLAPGLLSPALALLVLRGHPRTAAASTVAVLACLAWLRVTASDEPLWAPPAVMLASAPVVWWTWGVVSHRLRRTSRLDLIRSDSAYGLAREERRRTRERAEARDRRRQLLEVSAVPMLETVAAAGAPLDDDVRTALTAVEKDLRAELRGRDLLDAEVRRAAGGARGRGVRVDVVDHAPPGADLAVLPPLRALVAAGLAACTDGEITARRPPHGLVLTLVHVGSPASMDAVQAGVRHLAGQLSSTGEVVAEVTADEDAVVVEVSR